MQSGRFAVSLECKVGALLLGKGDFARAGPYFIRLAWQVAKVMRVGCFFTAFLNAKRALCFFFGMQSGRFALSRNAKQALCFWKQCFC